MSWARLCAGLVSPVQTPTPAARVAGCPFPSVPGSGLARLSLCPSDRRGELACSACTPLVCAVGPGPGWHLRSRSSLRRPPHLPAGLSPSRLPWGIGPSSVSSRPGQSLALLVVSCYAGVLSSGPARFSLLLLAGGCPHPPWRSDHLALRAGGGCSLSSRLRRPSFRPPILSPRHHAHGEPIRDCSQHSSSRACPPVTSQPGIIRAQQGRPLSRSPALPLHGLPCAARDRARTSCWILGSLVLLLRTHCFAFFLPLPWVCRCPPLAVLAALGPCRACPFREAAAGSHLGPDPGMVPVLCGPPGPGLCVH